MSTVTELLEQISNGKYDAVFLSLYGGGMTASSRKRYINALRSYLQLYGNTQARIFSAPGRAELSGNHTDHNGGKALGTAVSADIIAVASKTDDGIITVKSEEYDTADKVKINGIPAHGQNSASLIYGISDGFIKKGYNCGGMNIYTSSCVPAGSGLSSSAAFETLICTVISCLYNGGAVAPYDIALIGKYAENVYFGKPCGLLDQLCCSHGGVLYIDFGSEPSVTRLELDLNKYGYCLAIINTGGNHSDLTGDYASVPFEMKSVAHYFENEILRFTDEALFYESIPRIREKLGDRAVLRAMHFFEENKRVEKQAEAIINGDINGFLRIAEKCGESSSALLQNTYPLSAEAAARPIPLAIALSKHAGAVCKIQGGGFAGTVQAYVKNENKNAFKECLERVFGGGACVYLDLRAAPPMEIKANSENAE